jgi:hypothetical protein
VVGQTARTAKEQLVGSWTLVSLTAGEGVDQPLPYGPNPKGSMMADANGRFMITVVRSDLPNFASNNRMVGTPDENNSVVQGSIAYYGAYTIDEATRVIIEGSTFPKFHRRHADAHPLVQWRRRGDLSQPHAVARGRAGQSDV